MILIIFGLIEIDREIHLRISALMIKTMRTTMKATLYLRLCWFRCSIYLFRFFCFVFSTAVSTSVSFVLSSVLAVLLFSTMQLYRPWFASAQWNTILGGYIGSWLFILALTVRNSYIAVNCCCVSKRSDVLFDFCRQYPI